MRIERDVEIAVSDGLALRANVFRPDSPGRFPVILTHGAYGKDVHFLDWNPPAWKSLLEQHPEVCEGSSGQYLNWETPDPERWVPHGYAVVRVDGRGSGKSPGVLDVYSDRDRRDMYETIEWAGQQPWSSGKVGMLGISYYANAQWRVASLKPPHLAAIIPWEGWADHYRDRCYSGGIRSNTFVAGWWTRGIAGMQHGRSDHRGLDPATGASPTGPEVLSDEQLRANRVEYLDEIKQHPLDDEWHRDRSPDFSSIDVPLLSAGNWGGLGLHLRGNVEGFLQSASAQKWLEIHPGTHWEEFYARRGVELQRRFFDHFLKGVDNGWDDEPPVLLAIRRPDGVTYRKEQEWPLARTRWTRLHLDAATARIEQEPPPREARVTYDALGDGVTFLSSPFPEEVEITGPVRLRLHAASSTRDLDVFATVRAFDPQGNEVTFVGASEPRAPVTQGWLRGSHRRLDQAASTDFRPYHPHDRVEPLSPGEVVVLDVEIWPTSMVFPSGYRLGLTISGRDFQRPGGTVPRGSGPFLHTDPDDRDPGVFGGRNTLVTGAGLESYLLLPVIPSETS